MDQRWCHTTEASSAGGGRVPQPTAHPPFSIPFPSPFPAASPHSHAAPGRWHVGAEARRIAGPGLSLSPSPSALFLQASSCDPPPLYPCCFRTLLPLLRTHPSTLAWVASATTSLCLFLLLTPPLALAVGFLSLSIAHLMRQ
eukprot:GGOE01045683.1.p2 GENE.GGOE01045683.1~~GGOE01045683.1.p2  ORF type:complete len:142 (-),score=10.33 GGOE01045683.1:57-482(-)